ncbi:nitroreductase family protein [Propionispira raffinosivorans]|uniref:nitroreductase family protein n=1 Tax=Propionispira raffinosivorans TaxID=86959 RepID=UPI000363B411|nr:nitroreductase family protein [Propionispira raffinosivorans]
MNYTTKSIINHRSIWNYLKKEVPVEMVDSIIEAAMAMPTPRAGQELSVLVIKDDAMKLFLASLSGDNNWLAQAPLFLMFVVDVSKSANLSIKEDMAEIRNEDLTQIMHGTFECGMAMGAAVVAAESMGLGVVPLESLIMHPEAAKLLKLAKFTFLGAGLVVGYPAGQTKQKPRVPLNAFMQNETYQMNAVE